MKYLIFLLIACTSPTSIGQNHYEEGMQKALDLWGEDKPWEAINLFERIASAEPDEWLPPYYASLIGIVNGFGMKDEAKLKDQLDKSMGFLNDAKTISEDNPELLTLEALWYTVWVAYDGARYGMTYSGKVTQLYQEALKLAPDNPRVILNKAEWDMGSARFFGQPLDPYCEDIYRAIELFDDFNPEEKFYPTYGLERANQIVEETCK